MFLDRLLKYSKTDRIAAFDGKDYISFRELWHRSEAIAHYLIYHFQDKKPIAIFGDKQNDMLSCMIAAIKSGRPYICIPSYYPEGRIADILEDSGAVAVLNPERRKNCSTAKPLISSVMIDGICSEYHQKERISEDFYIQSGEVVCIIYTSGSTGRPKGVLLTLENIESKIKLTEEFMWPSIPQDGTGRAVNLASYAFSASLSYIYYVMIYAGCTLFTVPMAILQDTGSLADYLIKINPNVFSCTPGMMERLIETTVFSSSNIPAMNYCCLGGEPLMYSTVVKIRKKFPEIRLLNALGVTEAAGTPLICEITPELMKENHQFFPVGDAKTRYAYLMDENGERISDNNQCGELIICSETVGQGYLNQPKKTKQFFFIDDKDRWAYHSGDVLKNINGYYYFIGRKDNQVKIGGNRIELEDVEWHIKNIDFIKECGVAVRTDQFGMNALTAFIVKKDDTHPKMKSIMAIKQYLREHVQSYMIPSKIVFVESLPKNVNQKMDRVALKKWANDGI